MSTASDRLKENEIKHEGSALQRPNSGNGRFLQLLSVLQRCKGGVRESGLFAFTSALRGEGVSYVTSELASDLACNREERVLLIQASVLRYLRPEDVEWSSSLLREDARGVWSAYAAPASAMTAAPDLRADLLTCLRRNFTYVLVDCDALRASPEVLRIATHADGIVLVVGAGHATQGQVLHAARVLQLGSDKLLGSVLNKRTRAVPKFLERYAGSAHGSEND